MTDLDVEMGLSLESRGDLAGAEAAFRRADAAGHPGGSYGLGRLYFVRGDIPAAIAVLRRCDQLGSGDGSYNLAVLLKETGDQAGAETAFRRAGERGNPGGWSGYGKELEARGDDEAAEDAYRRAAGMGDAEGAFDLAAVLLRQDRMADGVAALRHAAELGHPGAPDILEALAEETGSLARFGVDMELAAVDEYRGAVLAQRAKLSAVWASLHQPTVRLDAGLRALSELIVARTQAVGALLARFRQFNYLPMPHTPGTNRIIVGDPIIERSDGTVMVDPDLRRRMDVELNAAALALNEARGRLLAGRLLNKATEHLNNHGRLLSRLEGRRAAMKRDLTAAIARKEEIGAARTAAQAELDAAWATADVAERRLPAALRPWSDQQWQSRWKEQATGLGAAHLYLGRIRPTPDDRLGDNADFGTGHDLPYALRPDANLHLMHTVEQRADVHALLRAMLLRVLVSAAPGNVRFTFFDPIGLGQSASSLLELAEYDPALIGGKVWSSTADLQQRLVEHTAHIELVIQKYLRSTYTTIDDYNRDAGEVAEPYRYLVVFDFPSGFTEETTKELLRIVQNGPRCGVRVLLMTNLGLEVPYGVQLAAVTAQAKPFAVGRNLLVEADGYSMELALDMDSDRSVPPALIAGIVDHIGRQATSRNEAVVTFDGVFALFREAALKGIAAGLPPAAGTVDPADPSSWWSGSTADAAVAPIGRAGAREVAALVFDSGNHAGALLVGRPGSGKSTLLHSYLAGVTTFYGPDELELYLVDFKEGVEFQVYAREALPHARCVAIESDREFGLSVLQSLEAELKRRGDLLRSSGGQHSGLTALRRATGEVIPRILLVFDEFHVLFARNDKVGLAAAALLETLVRQGRSFGIHLLLGSQSLAGLDALGSHVPQLLPTRILLPATEADARRVLGEGNDAGQYLTKHGEGILNPAGGAVEANQRFRGAFSDEAERRQRVARMRAKADEAGFTRRPIVFEGNAATPIESIRPGQFREELTTSGRAPLRIRVGSPMTISGAADLQLAREPGANVLVVARDGGDGDGAVPGAGDTVPRSQLAVAVASLALSPARIDVVDFTTVDDGIDVVLGPLLERDRVRVHRRRGFPGLLRELRTEVRDRVATDDAGGVPRTLFLYGVHRARDLDVGGLDGDPELVEVLEEILRDGPEVGVHTWAWCETVGGLARRLPASVLREFAWRVAGKQSPDDSQRLLGSDEAAELRDRQVLLVNDDRGLIRRCTTYTVPTGKWLAELLDTFQRSA
jgi:tetratricopeptide (TPR) repeat protein